MPSWLFMIYSDFTFDIQMKLLILKGKSSPLMESLLKGSRKEKIKQSTYLGFFSSACHISLLLSSLQDNRDLKHPWKWTAGNSEESIYFDAWFLRAVRKLLSLKLLFNAKTDNYSISSPHQCAGKCFILFGFSDDKSNSI